MPQVTAAATIPACMTALGAPTVSAIQDMPLALIMLRVPRSTTVTQLTVAVTRIASMTDQRSLIAPAIPGIN